MERAHRLAQAAPNYQRQSVSSALPDCVAPQRSHPAGWGRAAAAAWLCCSSSVLELSLWRGRGHAWLLFPPCSTSIIHSAKGLRGGCHALRVLQNSLGSSDGPAIRFRCEGPGGGHPCTRCVRLQIPGGPISHPGLPEVPVFSASRWSQWLCGESPDRCLRGWETRAW